jgi:hypothetical protein
MVIQIGLGTGIYVSILAATTKLDVQPFFNVHGTRHSQNAGLGCHFPMDTHAGGVEPRKPGRSDCSSTPTSLGVRMNEGSYPASLNGRFILGYS